MSLHVYDLVLSERLVCKTGQAYGVFLAVTILAYYTGEQYETPEDDKTKSLQESLCTGIAIAWPETQWHVIIIRVAPTINSCWKEVKAIYELATVRGCDNLHPDREEPSTQKEEQVYSYNAEAGMAIYPRRGRQSMCCRVARLHLQQRVPRYTPLATCVTKGQRGTEASVNFRELWFIIRYVFQWTWSRIAHCAILTLRYSG